MDNEVAVFKVTLDSHEFDLLKDRADFRGLNSPRQNLTNSFDLIKERAKSIIEGFKVNYTDWYPGVDISSMIPELNIGNDGFPNLDADEIIKGMDFDKSHYVNFDFVNDNLELYVYHTNSNFDIVKINDKINEINNSLYSRSQPKSSLSLAEQLNNNNLNTQIEPLFKSISNSNITLFNGEVIDNEVIGTYNDDEDDYDDAADETDYDEYENDYPDSFKTKIGSLEVDIAGYIFIFINYI